MVGVEIDREIKKESVDVSDMEQPGDEVILRGGVNTSAIIRHRGNHRSHVRGVGRQALYRDMKWMRRYHK